MTALSVDPEIAPTEATRRPSPSLVYLYCIVEAGSHAVDVLQARAVPGLDPDEPLFPLREGDLIAAVSHVPRTTFLATPLNELLADLPRLAPYALAHETAVRALLPHAPALLPIAFGAVYRSRASVRTRLREQRRDFEKALACVRGKQEWEIKVFCRTGDLFRHVINSQKQPAGAGPGHAYLLGLQRERDSRLEADRLLTATIDRVGLRLETAAAEVHIERLAGDQENDVQLICRIAVLAGRDSTDALFTAASELQREIEPIGLTLDVGGPWAPYSFVRGRDGDAGNAR